MEKKLKKNIYIYIYMAFLVAQSVKNTHTHIYIYSVVCVYRQEDENGFPEYYINLNSLSQII